MFIIGLERSWLEPRWKNIVRSSWFEFNITHRYYFSYFTDSLKNIIYAYDYEEGKISNRRIFIDANVKGFGEMGFCDGLCVDSEGAVWSAR